MRRFEWCQSTESMIGDHGRSRKSRLEPGTVLGTKSAKRSRDVFHDSLVGNEEVESINKSMFLHVGRLVHLHVCKMR